MRHKMQGIIKCIEIYWRVIMRNADIATAVRIAFIPLIIYSVLLRLNPVIPVALFIAALALDGVDGFLALNEESKGAIGIGTYFRYALGDEGAARLVKRYKPKIAKTAGYGPRID